MLSGAALVGRQQEVALIAVKREHTRVGLGITVIAMLFLSEPVVVQLCVWPRCFVGRRNWGANPRSARKREGGIS